jgi:SOS-response transcriptional repressor LexA
MTELEVGQEPEEPQGLCEYHLTAEEMDAESVSFPPADIDGLSPRCADILRFLYEYTAAHNGMSPTMRKIGDAVGISSTSVTKYNLNILQERGYITFGGAGRQRHIGIVGAQYSNPPLPVTAVEDDDSTRAWVDEMYRRRREYQHWAALADAMAAAFSKESAQRIEREILGDRDGR